MTIIHRSLRTGLLGALSTVALLASSTSASAQQGEAPGSRDDFRMYPIEIEPHFTFGAENVYGATGFGAGLRLGIPLISGAIGRLPDNLAISFGADIVHYENCYYSGQCGANYLMLPVAAQWNIFVARRVSLFAEGGAFVYKGFFDGCGPGDGPGCSPPSDFGVLPTVAIGARIHIGDNVSFTARLGYPTITFGVSFL
jgi:hypothetical protein